MDVSRAYSECSDMINNLNKAVEEPSKWQTIYSNAQNMAISLGAEMIRSRNQIMNPDQDSTEGILYKIYIFIDPIGPNYKNFDLFWPIGLVYLGQYFLDLPIYKKFWPNKLL